MLKEPPFLSRVHFPSSFLSYFLVVSCFGTTPQIKMANLAGTPLRLPCGLVLKNRLIKSAMSEKMAVKDQPTNGHHHLYERWAHGGWAALITGRHNRTVYHAGTGRMLIIAVQGNIMVDEMHLGSPGDVVVSGTDSAIVEAWAPWTRSAHRQGCRIIAQL
jgi:2,4-dienoyl-CoA reductase-like NADH-dependent reductase (Old Yellow Enzyme family)